MPTHRLRPTSPPPVFLVHGIFRRGRQMRRLRDALEAAGRITHAPDLTPNDGSAPILELAAQLGEHIAARVPAGEPCDLVGHSMGGLVARVYAQRLAPRGQVRRLVTLAAPHNGSMLAWFWPGAGARDLRPGSPLLRALARDTHQLAGAGVASLWTPYDLMIVPPRSSVLPVGCNLRLPLPHHRALITDRRVARLVCGLLLGDIPLPDDPPLAHRLE